MTQPRVCVVNLGCKVNRVESDWMEEAFASAGAVLAPQAEADIVAINTCAVTGEAEAKTRKAVRHAAGLAQRPLVAVTGCVANLFPRELEALGANVRVLPAKATLAADALALWGERARDGHAGAQPAACSDGMLGAAPAQPHGAFRSRRGIKVQDGCDNRCTYCIVWKARGASSSAPLADIERQVAQVCAQGADEVVLSGINLAKYRGVDAHGEQLDLGGLLDRVCALGARLVRLSSIEPPDLTGSILDAMARHADTVAAHLHLPLQSGSTATLARMGRRYTAPEFAAVVDRVRAALPNASVSTDVIVGFPGETDDEFEESLALCRAMRFSKMHVFRYSARPGTQAAAMAAQVPAEIARERSERMRALANELRRADACSRVGTVETALAEYIDADGTLRGTTASYHDVVVPAGEHGLTAPGLVRVELTGTVGVGAALYGRVLA